MACDVALNRLHSRRRAALSAPELLHLGGDRSQAIHHLRYAAAYLIRPEIGEAGLDLLQFERDLVKGRCERVDLADKLG